MATGHYTEMWAERNKTWSKQLTQNLVTLINENGMPRWYWAGLAFLLGSIMASFCGVIIERLPRKETLGGRSLCRCGRTLKISENIPIYGWLRAGGQTPCCQNRIPPWYLLSEIMSGLGWGLAVNYWGWTGLLVAGLTTITVTAASIVIRNRQKHN